MGALWRRHFIVGGHPGALLRKRVIVGGHLGALRRRSCQLWRARILGIDVAPRPRHRRCAMGDSALDADGGLGWCQTSA